MKNLQLSLKRKWFEMTKSGGKTEDYREINRYWTKRFIYNFRDVLLHTDRKIIDFISDEDAYRFILNPRSNYGFNQFNLNIVTLGYPKSTNSERVLKLEHKGIEIRTGNQEWGAEPGKLYFVIKHGFVLE
jgi:hypothetical protein